MKSGFLFRELGGLIHASALYHEFRLEPLRVTNFAQGLKGMPGSASVAGIQAGTDGRKAIRRYPSRARRFQSPTQGDFGALF